MKTTTPSSQRGYALLLVLAFTGVSLLMVTGVLTWSSQSAGMTSRNNEYYTTLAAAEGATERIISQISRDFRGGGEALVYARLGAYTADTPPSSEASQWTSYQFSNGQGTADRTFVSRMAPSSYVTLDSQYRGLHGFAATYRIVSNAKNLDTRKNLTAAVGQDIQVASIPLFQFAIFYSLDLEINPGPAMTITGPVHSNGDIYTQPQNALVFQSDVTSAGNIVAGKKPGDPTGRTPGSIAYNAEHDSGVSTMNLPIGTNNSPSAIRAVLEIPPFGESLNSDMGKQRYYNKADMIILVTNVTTTTVTSRIVGGRLVFTTNVVVTTQVIGKSGSANGFATVIPPQQLSFFVATNASFYDKREGATIKPIDIDVGNLKIWSLTNNNIRPALGDRDVDSLYIADLRPQNPGEEPAVRIKNGQTLPSLGLTVASPDPIYVQGNFNVPTAALGTTNTSQTKPASLIGDSINILSTAWNDATSTQGIANRIAANTTVNAAFLGGIVQTVTGSYSGGVENFPRFLEDWSNKTFTYNGSMVVMFDSRIGVGRWGSSDVYSPPRRGWAFDNNFLDPTKLPPGTPQILSLIRGRWSAIPAGTTTF